MLSSFTMAVAGIFVPWTGLRCCRLPSTVVRPDRGKATAVWLILLLGFVGYILYLGLNARDMRNNPPVKIQIKVNASS